MVASLWTYCGSLQLIMLLSTKSTQQKLSGTGSVREKRVLVHGWVRWQGTDRQRIARLQRRHRNHCACVEAQIRIRVDDVEEILDRVGNQTRRKEDPIGRGCNTALAEIAPATNRHHREDKKRGSGKKGRSLHDNSLSDARFRSFRWTQGPSEGPCNPPRQCRRAKPVGTSARRGERSGTNYFFNTAWAAANRAIGKRYGEQDT